MGGFKVARVAVTALLVAVACSSDSEPRTSEPEEQAQWLHLGLGIDNTRATSDHEDAIDAANVDQLAADWELSDVKGVSGTPIVDKGVVYVGDWTGHVRALEAEGGDEIWSRDLETNYIGGSVALDADHVFAGTFDGRLVALDRDSGDPVWEEPIGDHEMGAIFGSPIHHDGLVIVGVASFENFVSNQDLSFRGHVVALDAESGDEVWRYWTTAGNEDEGPGASVWSTPTIDTEREHVYITTGNTYAEPPAPRSDSFIALDLHSGEELWTTQVTEGDVWAVGTDGQDADLGAPANMFKVEDTDAIGAGDKAGVYHALDRESGDELWSTPLTEGGLQGGVLASSAVHDGVIYNASNKGGGPADLVALDDDDGDELWRVEVGASVTGPITWSNGLVYVADNSGRIAAYDDADGTRMWSHEVDSPAAGGISIVDGTVYAGWGWWLAAPPPDPKGGMIAFRLGEDGGSDGQDDDEAAGESASGEEIYQEHCASCHGGSGEGANGPSLVGVTERLTREEHIEIVRDGSGEMPAWEGTLSPEAIDAVVEYERTEFGQ